MASEMQERIARAIWSIRREEEDRCDMELEDMGRKHPVWDEALAAMRAMREPTLEMEKTGDAFIDFGSDFTETWRAAIDAEIYLAEGSRS